MPRHEAEAKHKMGIRALDLYVWAVLLGNTDLAIVLLPMDVEPVRSALIGARICNYMAEQLPVEAKQLTEAARRHEDWAIEILDLCANQEAATCLLTSPTRHWDRNVIGLATFSDMKHFVSHRYCQNMCDSILQGNVEGGCASPPHARCRILLPPEYAHAQATFDTLRVLAHAFFPFLGIVQCRPLPNAVAPPTILSFYYIPFVKVSLTLTLALTLTTPRSAGSAQPLTLTPTLTLTLTPSRSSKVGLTLAQR